MRGLLLILMMASLFACQKAKLNKADKVLTSNSWQIEEFTINSESVMSAGYQEYTFTFDEIAAVVHAKITSLQTDVLGGWNLLEEDQKATLSLKMENPLNQLTEQWKIESVSKSKMVLSAGGKELTFLVKE